MIRGCDGDGLPNFTFRARRADRGLFSSADTRRAISQCRKASHDLDNVEPAARQVALSEGCADLFVEQRCHDAWAKIGEVPTSQRIEHVITECRDAYCPILRDPKPELCSKPLPSDRVERAKLWLALAKEIHDLDLGVDETPLESVMRPPR
jgi:hypothetical protein